MVNEDSYGVVSFVKQKDYEMIDGDLGSGSFGRTVLLRDPFIDELFVAKKYEPEDDSIKEEFYKKFLDEIKILYNLSHRNIVRIYNYYAYENLHTGYILMEYVNGQNIEEYIDSLSPWDDERKLDDVFEQIIGAFCYMESKGVVHRDIREKNILITNDGVVKVIDFGIGKLFEGDTPGAGASRDSLVGEINRPNTLPQEYSEQKYTIRTDMFYIGELFNRLCKSVTREDGHPAFSYREIVEKMMEVQPDDRYESFSAIQELLSQDALDRMSVSKSDKEIYRNFAKGLYSCISDFSKKPSYNTEKIFISKLEKVLRENMFEDYVQNNSALIDCVVQGGGYSFYGEQEIVKVDDLKKFIEWFKCHNGESREIIVANIINKLNKIKIIEEYDVPF